MKGRIESIFIASERKAAALKQDKVVLEAGKGIVGDRYHAISVSRIDAGDAALENHITLIAKEELDRFLASQKADIGYGEFRRNIITSGIDLNSLEGKEFNIGGVRCFGAELCEPCATLSQIAHPAVLPELVHRGGLRATILSDGDISIGEAVGE